MRREPDLGNVLEQRIERMGTQAWALLESNGITGTTSDSIARAWGNGGGGRASGNGGRAWGNGGRGFANGGGGGFANGYTRRIRELVSTSDYGPIGLLVIQSTSLCNLDCSYCYLPDRQKRSIFNLQQQ